ncbi:MAG: hypothetical protein D6B26_06190, partial [Spirochaetaceae bacterium]
YAWWWKAGTQAVGELLPNALGLYDMSGNVNEWCYDTEDGWPAAIPETDFRNNFSYAERVVRGGGWNTNDGVQYELQTGYRYPDGATEPYSITDSRGFRVARYPGE